MSGSAEVTDEEPKKKKRKRSRKSKSHVKEENDEKDDSMEKEDETAVAVDGAPIKEGNDEELEAREAKKQEKRKKKKDGKEEEKEKEDDGDGDNDEKVEQDRELEKEEEPETKQEGADTADDNDDNNEDVAEKPKRKRKRKRKKKDSGDGDDGDGGNNQDVNKLESLEHTVYVEGIPFDCKEEDVKQFFVDNGCSDVLQMRLQRWQDTGRLRGYGHIVFDTTQSRQTAIQQLNGKHLGKRYLKIVAPNQPNHHGAATPGSKPRTQPEGCKTVFVKNLPYRATEDDIRQEFQVCGKILDGGVRIARNFQTRQSKGFAYVEFKNVEGAHGAVHKAHKRNGMLVLGRPVFVDYDEGRVKGSFKTQDGRLWSREHKRA